MMFRRLIAFGILLATALVGSVAIAQEQSALLIRGGHLFDSTGDERRPNPGILVINGKIAAIGIEGDDDPRLPETLCIVDLAGEATVMPGIVDLHAHYNIRVMDRPRTDETEHYAAIYLANGVTSTFPAGEYNPEAMLEMRRRIDRGEQPGPRVLTSGPYYGLSMRRSATVQEVHDRVDTWAANGAAGFKAKQISPEHLAALIERAHHHGLTVTAHLDSGFRNTVNPRDAILMGIDRIEHFLGGDLLPEERSAYASLEELTDADLESDAFQRIVELFIDRHVYFDATLTAYGYFGAESEDDVYERWTDESRFFAPEIQAWLGTQTPPRPMEQFVKIYRVKQKTLKRFFDAGGGHLITLGTDHVSDGRFLQGFSAHREMHAMSKAGIPNAAVLRIATINGARAIGMGDLIGTIEVGKLADMIVLRGDPLQDIRNTRDLRLVIRSGVMHNPQELFAGVEGKLGAMLLPSAEN